MVPAAPGVVQQHDALRLPWQQPRPTTRETMTQQATKVPGLVPDEDEGARVTDAWAFGQWINSHHSEEILADLIRNPDSVPGVVVCDWEDACEDVAGVTPERDWHRSIRVPCDYEVESDEDFAQWALETFWADIEPGL